MTKGRPNRTGVDWSDPEAVAAYKRGSQPHKDYNAQYFQDHYTPSDRLPEDRNQVHGEAHWSAKLTANDVREIRASDEPLAVLARRYGVSKSAISQARRGETWKDLD